MTTPDASSPRILVSGASISGLTVAYWLARYGFERLNRALKAAGVPSRQLTNVAYWAPGKTGL